MKACRQVPVQSPQTETSKPRQEGIQRVKCRGNSGMHLQSSYFGGRISEQWGFTTNRG